MSKLRILIDISDTKKSEYSESLAGRSFIIICIYSYYLNVRSIQVALICNKLQPYVTKN